MTLYEQLIAEGIETANWQSDLYAPATPRVLELVRAAKVTYSFFRNNITGTRWVEVPFAYTPFWTARGAH